jgi:hypothetical protein
MVAQYPGAVADDGDLYVTVNNLGTTLLGALGASGDNTGGLGIAVVSTFNFPTVGFITIDDEAISYTGINANMFTGTVRAADGTTAASHANGVNVQHDYIAAHHNVLKNEIEAIESDGIDIRRNALYNNIIVNGNFDNWQRGTSFTNPANGSYTTDAWKINFAGTFAPAFVIAEEPTGANIYQGQFAFKLTCTYTGTSLTEGLFISQSVEDVYNYRGQTLTLSVAIKTSLVNSVRISVSDDSGTVVSSFHPGDSTYHILTVTKLVSSTATFLTVNVGMLNPVDVQVGVFWADACMFIIGTTPFAFQHQNPFLELARCQRFYENQPNLFYRFYDSIGGAQYSIPIHFSVPKQSAPTISISNGTIQHVASTAAGGVSTRGFDLLINTNAGTGDTYIGGINDASWSAATT